jgi:hypothetical protein
MVRSRTKDRESARRIRTGSFSVCTVKTGAGYSALVMAVTALAALA